MLCKMIDELSLEYMEKELGESQSKKLLNHLKKCGKCMIKYNLINGNYTPERNIGDYESRTISSYIKNNGDIAKEVMSRIDKSLYEKNRIKIRKKRIIIAVACLMIILTASINAKSIHKTYEELKEIMFVSKERLIENLTKNMRINQLLEDEDYIKQIYNKFSGNIEAQIDGLKTGMIKTFEYEEENGVFLIAAAKGREGNFITYGFKDHKMFHNDYNIEINQKRVNPFLNREYFSSIDDLVKSGEMAVYPGYVPDGYEFTECFRNLSNTLRTVAIAYENSENNWVKFGFITGRIAEGDGGPGELLEINGRQAFYSEQVNYGNKFNQLAIYLGDGMRFPTLVVSSNVLGKGDIIKIAENLELVNEDKNSIENNPDYFVNIKDKRILDYADEYMRYIKSGKSDFSFKIDENTEFYKRSQDNTYNISYSNTNYNDIREYLYTPLKIDNKILNEYNLEFAQVIGQPYAASKKETYHFKKGDNRLTIMMDVIGTTNSFTNKVDALLDNIFASEHCFIYQPFYGSSDQLYYYLNVDDYKEIRTVFEEDGYLYRVMFVTTRGDLLKDHDSVQQFIDGIESNN